MARPDLSDQNERIAIVVLRVQRLKNLASDCDAGNARMKWRTVSTTILFLMLIAMPMLGLQTVSAQDSKSLSVGSWWTLKGTYRQMDTGSGSWEGTYTETAEYTGKISVTSKNSDTITLSDQEDGTWSCTATDNWACWMNDKHVQEASDTWSNTYQYTIALNTLKVIGVGGDASKSYVGHPTWYIVNVGQLNEGGKAARHWWVPDSNAKGSKIADVNFSVDTQTAKIRGAELKVWRLSYSGDTLGWWRNDNGVYSTGPATRTDLYDPIYGIWVGYSEKSTTNGVAAGGDGSWTEDFSEDLQFVDTNLSFTMAVTLNAEPGGHVAVTVDGVEYGPDQLPMVFDWAIGDTHTLEVNATVDGAKGVRYVFVQWSDGSKDASRTIAATESGNLTATFKTQYELKVTSDLGDPQGGGWYDEGSTATFSVTSPQPETGLFGSLGGKKVFQEWNGDSTAHTSTADIVMDGPKSVQAQWTTDDSQPYMIMGGIAVAIVAVVVVILMLMRRRGATQVQAQPSPVVPAKASRIPRSSRGKEMKYCIHCGATIASTAKFCAECGKKQK